MDYTEWSVVRPINLFFYFYLQFQKTAYFLFLLLSFYYILLFLQYDMTFKVFLWWYFPVHYTLCNVMILYASLEKKIISKNSFRNGNQNSLISMNDRRLTLWTVCELFIWKKIWRESNECFFIVKIVKDFILINIFLLFEFLFK